MSVIQMSNSLQPIRKHDEDLMKGVPGCDACVVLFEAFVYMLKGE